MTPIPEQEVQATFASDTLRDLSRALDYFSEKNQRPAKSLGELMEGGFFMPGAVPQAQTRALALIEFPFIGTNAAQPTNATAAFLIEGKLMFYLLETGEIVRATVP